MQVRNNMGWGMGLECSGVSALVVYYYNMLTIIRHNTNEGLILEFQPIPDVYVGFKTQRV